MEKNETKQGTEIMKTRSAQDFWEEQNHAWRNPSQVAAQWMGSLPIEPAIFKYRESKGFFSILDDLRLTLLVTREYEHIVLAMTVVNGRPVFSYLGLPHPSGMAVDINKEVVYIASTRNPNMIFEFSPLKKLNNRLDIPKAALHDFSAKVLIPRHARYVAGCFYIHDLALIDGLLYANSVGKNAVVRVDEDNMKTVWWPRCIEVEGRPIFEQNYIQLNSIAAGKNIKSSYFSASADKISSRRPGHRNFPVDKRGVIFSGKTREPIVSGLTRPHSARLYNEQLYVDNSGYGELIVVQDGKPNVLSKFSGWTRGLGFYGDIAFVGTSRVISRFRQYAPGLDVDKSQCGIHAVNIKTGDILGSLIWPNGNQIFSIEPVPQKMTLGFPSVLGLKNSLDEERRIYYSFSL